MFARFLTHLMLGNICNPYLYWVYLDKFNKWCDANNKEGNIYSTRYDVYDFIISKENIEEICYLEFGVHAGKSLKWWLEHNKYSGSRFFGFDSFWGLPERWGIINRGTFSMGGVPPEVNDARCSFIKGFFQDTLSAWLKTAPLQGKIVVNLDADLYFATIYVLEKLAPFLKKGDILIFDEFHFPLDEFKAFTQFIEEYHYSYKFLGASKNYWCVAIKIL